MAGVLGKPRKQSSQLIRVNVDANSKAAHGMMMHMTHGSPQFIIGPDGRRQGVVLGMTHYLRLLRRIEDLEDSVTLDRAAETSKKLVPYESVRKRLIRTGKL